MIGFVRLTQQRAELLDFSSLAGRIEDRIRVSLVEFLHMPCKAL